MGVMELLLIMTEKYDPNRHIFADPQRRYYTWYDYVYILERCGSYRVRYFLTR